MKTKIRGTIHSTDVFCFVAQARVFSFFVGAGFRLLLRWTIYKLPLENIRRESLTAGQVQF